MAMNIFDGRLNSKIFAQYVAVNRKTPLGVEQGETSDVTIIVDESFTNSWQSETVTQASDVLVYGYPDSVLGHKSCVGGLLKFDGRTFRIETFALVKNQLTGQYAHVELGCAEL
jgi:hypothetical protein